LPGLVSLPPETGTAAPPAPISASWAIKPAKGNKTASAKTPQRTKAFIHTVSEALPVPVTRLPGADTAILHFVAVSRHEVTQKPASVTDCRQLAYAKNIDK
jgi:hypothetical protein